MGSFVNNERHRTTILHRLDYRNWLVNFDCLSWKKEGARAADSIPAAPPNLPPIGGTSGGLFEH